MHYNIMSEPTDYSDFISLFAHAVRQLSPEAPLRAIEFFLVVTYSAETCPSEVEPGLKVILKKYDWPALEAALVARRGYPQLAVASVP